MPQIKYKMLTHSQIKKIYTVRSSIRFNKQDSFFIKSENQKEKLDGPGDGGEVPANVKRPVGGG